MEATNLWSEIGKQWREREFGLLRQEVKGFEGVRVERLDGLLTKGDDTDPRTALAESFAAVAANPDARALLATYVYGKCLDRWEKSEDYGRIREVLDALRNAVGGYGERVPVLVTDHTLCMEDAMEVENGLNCSCPVRMKVRARRIVDRTDKMLDSADGSDLAEPAALLRSDAQTQRAYFSAVCDTAQAVDAFLKLKRPAPGNFAETIATLSKTEQGPAVHGDVFESELRAHRTTLAALNAAAPKPRICVDKAEIIYVYPFALLDAPADVRDVAKRVQIEGMRWALDERIKRSDACELRLTNIWEQPGAEKATYSAVALQLPDVAVTPTAGKKWTFHCQAELRLSRMGSHYLRVHSKLDGADLHDLNQALRRASPSMGNEKLVSAGASWGKFVDYAETVIDDVAAVTGAKKVGDPTTDFHVFVEARALTIQCADGTRSPASIGALEGAIGGSLLFHPVRHVARSLEEWIRYPPPEVENLMHGGGYIDDLAVRTANTTVLYMPSSPDWSITGYEEMVEFIATMAPLLGAWEQQIVEYGQGHKDLKHALQTPESLLDRKGELRALESQIRQELARLHSRRLVRNRVHREFIDRLWAAAGLQRLEAELERHLGVLGTLSEELTTQADKMEQKRRHDSRWRVELVLGGIGLVSVTSLFSWLNDDFGLDTHWVSAVEAAALVVMFGFLVMFILRERQ